MTDTSVQIPPIKIQGIKTKLVPLIRQYASISDADVWIEPFMGSGVVGFNLAPRKAIFADTNPHTIELYQRIQSGKITHTVVRSYLEQAAPQLRKMGIDFYYFVRERFNKHHDPLDFLFLNRSCFNGMIRFNKRGEFNVPYGHKDERFAKAYITKISNQVLSIEQKLQVKEWTFICQSYEHTIKNAPANALIYCDPPYIGRHVDYYDSWNEENELKLKETLQQHGGRFIVSTWHHNKYRKNEHIKKIWGDLYQVHQEHFYHVGAKETNRNAITEALLMNFVPSPRDNVVAPVDEQLLLFS